MAFEYGISAKLNVDGALANVEKLIKKLGEAEEKAGGLKVSISINNELVRQLQSLKNVQTAQKQVTENTTKQAQEEERLAALQEKTAGIKQKNAQNAQMAEERLNKAKKETAATEQKNAQNAAAAEQKLAAQKQTDDDAHLARVQKIRTEEQKTATEAEKTARVRQQTEDAATKAAQERANTQRKADQAAEEYSNRINEGRLRGEERVQQEQQRTSQSKINTLAAIFRLYDQISRTQYNNEERERRAADAQYRRQQRAYKEQKANDDAIARDLEKQARIEQAQAEIKEKNNAKTRELREAIEANQKAQETYNRVLAKALPTVTEIKKAMEGLALSEKNLKRAQYRANSPLSGLIGKVGPNGTWGNTLRSVGGWVSKSGEAIQGMTQAFDAVRQPAENLFSSLWSSASSFFNKTVNGFMNLTQEGIEAFGTLEMAEIGFANFFNGSATEFTEQIKKAAVKMPMVGAADLARSVQYIAPLAKGDSQLALGAVEGVMKSIVYSGNDVSQYGTKALQNLTQVASGNLTATDIKEMMRQMPALPRLLASTETGSELLEGGQITTKAVKNYIAKYGSDAILGVFKEISEKSEASDIYDIANTTFKGAIEQLQEKVVLSWQEAFEKSGASSLVKDLLNELAQDGGIIDQFTEQLAHYGKMVVEWIKNNQDEIQEFVEAVGEGMKEVAKAFKEVATEVLQALEVLDGSGKLNVQKLKEFVKQIADFIKGLVKGYGSGLKTVISLLDTLRQRLGEDTFRKLGEAIGFLASPMAKLISTLGMLASNAGRAAGGLLTLLGGITQFGGFDKLITGSGAITTKLGNGIEKWSGGKITSAGFVGGVNKVASGVGKGLKAASFIALGVAADQAVDSLMEIAGVDNGVQQAVSGLMGGITGAAAGFQIFGLKGALIGGLIGAITGLVSEINEQKKQLQAQRNAEAARQSKVKLAEDQKKIKEYVLSNLETAGFKLDTESKAGRFTEQVLEKYIYDQTTRLDKDGNVIGTNLGALYGKGQEMAEMVTGWYRTKLAEEQLAEFTASTAFVNKGADKGGRVIDFKQDTAARDWVADFVERNILNGDTEAYDYTNPNEQVVEDYLDGYQLTYEQLDLLKEKEADVYEALEQQTTDLSTTLANIDDGINDLANDPDSPLNVLADYTEDLNTLLLQMTDELAQIAINTGSDDGSFVSSGVPGAKFANGEEAINYSKWQEKVYSGKASNAAAKQTVNKHLTEWYKSGRVTSDEASSLMVRSDYSRDAVAKVYGKTVGDNDDYMETYDKFVEIWRKALANRDSQPENSDEWAKWDYIINNDFAPYQHWLKKIQPGDWVALFQFQRDAEKALGQYGLHFRAAGGIIERLFARRGRGVDTVPAFLQPGEFVMRKSSVEKAGLGVMAALNRGDFASAAATLGNKFHNSWDQSHHWTNQITTNNNNNTSNYFFAGGQVRGRRGPYRSMANRVATI